MVKQDQSGGLEDKPIMGSFGFAPGVVGVIAGRGNIREADRQGFTHIIPPVGDLVEFARLERALRSQGIRYGKRDIYPAFRSEQELNDALLKIHEAGYRNRATDDYLLRKGLIQKPDQ